MRDGQDKMGIWTMIEESMEYVCLPYLYVPHIASDIAKRRASTKTQHIPWLSSIRRLIPSLSAREARINKFAKEMVSERKKRGSMVKDLFHHLVSTELLFLAI